MPPVMAVAMTSIRLSTPSLPTAWAPENGPVFRVEEELERHRLRARVVARVAHRDASGWPGTCARPPGVVSRSIPSWRR